MSRRAYIFCTSRRVSIFLWLVSYAITNAIYIKLCLRRTMDKTEICLMRTKFKSLQYDFQHSKLRLRQNIACIICAGTQLRYFYIFSGFQITTRTYRKTVVCYIAVWFKKKKKSLASIIFWKERVKETQNLPVQMKVIICHMSWP